MDSIPIPASILFRAIASNSVDTLKTFLESSRNIDVDRAVNSLLGEYSDSSKDVLEKQQVKNVWNMWLAIFTDAGKKPKYRLTDKKKKTISARLKSFAYEDLVLVMCYVRSSKFWMGDNERNTPYYFVENIFRNDDRVEQLLASAQGWRESVQKLQQAVTAIQSDSPLDSAINRKRAAEKFKELGYTREIDIVIKSL